MELIKEAIRNRCRTKIACDDLGISVKTFKRWQSNSVDRREGPKTVPINKLTEKEVDEVIRISTSEEYCDDSPWQIVPKLADKGKYVASESSFYRILRKKNLLAHRGKSKEKVYYKSSPLEATGPNQIYSWDITYLRSPVKGVFYYLYMFMDVFSRKIVGWNVYEEESMEHSSQLIEKICEVEKIDKKQLILHADNGGAMKGATMLATLQKLEVIPSFSRPRVSDDNPYSESLFKTLKYCPQYPSNPFSSIDEAINWVNKFVNWYNYKHLHSGIKYVTPASRHEGKDELILKRRDIVYKAAKLANPNRWSRETRDWEKIKIVYLKNLLKDEECNTKSCLNKSIIGTSNADFHHSFLL